MDKRIWTTDWNVADMVLAILLGCFLVASMVIAYLWGHVSNFQWVFLLPMTILAAWTFKSFLAIKAARVDLDRHAVETVPEDVPEALAGTLVPASFTAVGILFTFIGLVSGLDDFGTESNQLLHSINSLVSGTQVAFRSSIAGIGASLFSGFAYRLMWRGYEQACHQRIVTKVLENPADLKPSHMMRYPELAMIKIANVLGDEEHQKRQLAGVLDEFSENFTKPLDHTFSNLQQTLDGFVKGQEASRKLYDASHDRLGKLADSMGGMIERQRQVEKSQHKAFDKLTTAIEQLERIDKSFQQIQEHLDTQTEQLKENQEHTNTANEQVRNLVEYLSRISRDQAAQSEKSYELSEQLGRTFKELSLGLANFQGIWTRQTEHTEKLEHVARAQTAAVEKLEHIGDAVSLLAQLPADLLEVQVQHKLVLSKLDHTSQSLQESLQVASKTSKDQQAIAAELGQATQGLEQTFRDLSNGIAGFQGAWAQQVEHTEKLERIATAQTEAIQKLEHIGDAVSPLAQLPADLLAVHAEHERTLVKFDGTSKAVLKSLHIANATSESQQAFATKLEDATQGLERTFRDLSNGIASFQGAWAQQVEHTRMLEHVASAQTEVVEKLEHIGESVTPLANLPENLLDVHERQRQLMSSFDDTTQRVDESLKTALANSKSQEVIAAKLDAAARGIQNLDGVAESISGAGEHLGELTKSLRSESERIERTRHGVVDSLEDIQLVLSELGDKLEGLEQVGTQQRQLKDGILETFKAFEGELSSILGLFQPTLGSIHTAIEDLEQALIVQRGERVEAN